MNKNLFNRADDLLKFLQKNARGFDERIVGTTLCEELGFSSDQHLRMAVNYARTHLHGGGAIASLKRAPGGYWIAQSSKELEDTYAHLTGAAASIETAAKAVWMEMERMKANGQE